MKLGKPVIAAVEGAAVAGGLELALWCDLRVAARNATFGVYCRRFGVPRMDLRTIRLPRLIGHSRAMDLILTGRGISGEEAERIGLANRLAEPGQALAESLRLAQQLARLPQAALCSDRLSAIAWSLDWQQATLNEFRLGIATVATGKTEDGARRFALGTAGTDSQSNRAEPRPCVARMQHPAMIDVAGLRTSSPLAAIEPKCRGHYGHSLRSSPGSRDLLCDSALR